MLPTSLARSTERRILSRFSAGGRTSLVADALLLSDAGYALPRAASRLWKSRPPAAAQPSSSARAREPSARPTPPASAIRSKGRLRRQTSNDDLLTLLFARTRRALSSQHS
jgi:hypothetical protein